MAKFIKPFLNLLFNKLSEGSPAFDTLLSVHIQIPRSNWISATAWNIHSPANGTLYFR